MSARAQLVEPAVGPRGLPAPAHRTVHGTEPTSADSEERGLSLLTFRAWALFTRDAALPDDTALAARAVLAELPLDLLGGRYAMFEPEVRSTLPASVIESWRFYAGAVEARGLGQVHVVDVVLSAAHDAVYLVRAATDEGEGFLEVYAQSGEPLASGRSDGGRVSSWDDAFGAARDGARRLAR